MLKTTETALTKFKEINSKAFYDCAIDFRPRDFGRDGSYYGDFEEVESIYQLMYTLSLQLDEQIFSGYYDNAYSNPLEPISEIQNLRTYLDGHITWLKEIDRKHESQLFPVMATLDNYLKTQKVLDYVLNLNEIKIELGDPKKEALKLELIELKVKDALNVKGKLVRRRIAIYTFSLLIPVIAISILWKNYHDGIWFQLLLFLFPVISFLYDKDSFIDSLKFCFSRSYRHKYLNDTTEDLKEVYK